MIVLRSNSELKQIFVKLITTLKVPVEWTGNFVVVGDYLILEGEVRSLFFNFESKKVATNLIEIPKSEEIISIPKGSNVASILNFVLYTFGKWGEIQGLRVEQTYQQLNAKFQAVLAEIKVIPELSETHFRFYHQSIRINYEDLIQLSLKELPPSEEDVQIEDEETLGLWHNLQWKGIATTIEQVEISSKERKEKRLGNNFYQIGYLCPKCKDKLFMSVFPETSKVIIDTELGKVILARVMTCHSCHLFITPKPEKLLQERDLFLLEFGKDIIAYEDYLELLGKQGDQVSNFRFNRFLEESNNLRQQAMDEQNKDESAHEKTKRSLERMQAMLQEGFYPEETVDQYKEKIREQLKKISEEKEVTADTYIRQDTKEMKKASPTEPIKASPTEPIKAQKERKETYTKERTEVADEKKESKDQLFELVDQTEEKVKEKTTNYRIESKERVQKKEIETEQIKLKQEAVKQEAVKHNKEDLEKNQEKNQGNNQETDKQAKSIFIMDKVSEEEIKEQKLPQQEVSSTKRNEEDKENRQSAPLNQHQLKNDQSQENQNQPKELNYSRKKTVFANEKEKEEEKKKLKQFVTKLPKESREELLNALKKIQDSSFSQKDKKPYEEVLQDKIKQIDQKQIQEIVKKVSAASFDETLDCYQEVKSGLFLPELKDRTLESLYHRLVQLKAKECESLSDKLRTQLEKNYSLNERYHFFEQEAKLDEVPEFDAVVEAALTKYGHSREEFEYPILVLDTSKAQNGGEGIILTPDYLYFNTLFRSAKISIHQIKKINFNSGFLIKGVYATLKKNEREKLPFEGEDKTMEKWAKELHQFIHYLQEKPQSRDVRYLAKEKHEQVICIRCGFSYAQSPICPNCGYKGNK